MSAAPAAPRELPHRMSHLASVDVATRDHRVWLTMNSRGDCFGTSLLTPEHWRRAEMLQGTLEAPHRPLVPALIPQDKRHPPVSPGLAGRRRRAPGPVASSPPHRSLGQEFLARPRTGRGTFSPPCGKKARRDTLRHRTAYREICATGAVLPPKAGLRGALAAPPYGRRGPEATAQGYPPAAEEVCWPERRCLRFRRSPSDHHSRKRHPIWHNLQKFVGQGQVCDTADHIEHAHNPAHDVTCAKEAPRRLVVAPHWGEVAR
jgi:hypothetical protein